MLTVEEFFQDFPERFELIAINFKGEDLRFFESESEIPEKIMKMEVRLYRFYNNSDTMIELEVK